MKVYYHTSDIIDYDIANFLKGFQALGYVPERKKISRLDELNEEDVYLSSINHIDALIPNWQVIQDYPYTIKDWLKRFPSECLWEQILKAEQGTYFIKPVNKGDFQPFISKLPLMGNLDMLAYLHVSENTPCWVQDPLTILTEWRVFVYANEIIDIRPYAGDPFLQTSKKFIESAIRRLDLDQPYIMDVGVCKEVGEFVIELNESLGFGTYGLSPELSAKMYLQRWKQILK